VGTPAQKTVNTASAQSPTNLKADNKNKGTTEDENIKEILVNPANPEKKLKTDPNLNPK
jgi:hypothetical protein